MYVTEDYWSSNAIGTQLRDPINSGTDPVAVGSIDGRLSLESRIAGER